MNNHPVNHDTVEAYQTEMRQESGVNCSLDRLRGQICELGDLINALEEKLAFVLLPPADGKQNTETSTQITESKGTSPVTDNIQDSKEELARLTRRLHVIMTRVDI